MDQVVYKKQKSIQAVSPGLGRTRPGARAETSVIFDGPNVRHWWQIQQIGVTYAKLIVAFSVEAKKTLTIKGTITVTISVFVGPTLVFSEPVSFIVEKTMTGETIETKYTTIQEILSFPFTKTLENIDVPPGQSVTVKIDLAVNNTTVTPVRETEAQLFAALLVEPTEGIESEAIEPHFPVIGEEPLLIRSGTTINYSPVSIKGSREERR